MDQYLVSFLETPSSWDLKNIVKLERVVVPRPALTRYEISAVELAPYHMVLEGDRKEDA